MTIIDQVAHRLIAAITEETRCIKMEYSEQLTEEQMGKLVDAIGSASATMVATLYKNKLNLR